METLTSTLWFGSLLQPGHLLTQGFFRDAYQIQLPDSGDLEDLQLLLLKKSEVESAIEKGQVKSLGVITMLLFGLRCLE